MSDEKIKKTEQNQPKTEPKKEKSIIRIDKISKEIFEISENSKIGPLTKPLKEGYQPTDELDTSDPPVDKGDDKTE